jgi:hypothetical protein
LGLVELQLGEPRRPAADPAARPGGGQALEGALDEMASRSNSANAAVILKNSRPIGVEVSMPCSSTTKSRLCCSNQADRSSRC